MTFSIPTTSAKTSSAELIKAYLYFTPLFFAVAYLAFSVAVHWAFLFPTAVYVWLQVRRAPWHILVVLGRLYWIKRLDTRNFAVGIGTTHELSAPWRTGKGIYFVVLKRSLQIGLCKEQELDEVSGVLSAVGGRYLDLEPKEIGDWHAVQKGKETGSTTS